MDVLGGLKAPARRVRAWYHSRGTGKPQGHRGIRKLGHREYVGGMWDEIGRLQFDYLVEQGLEPSDVLLDIGCGSLRGGVHFIRYLEPGHYLGMEKERELLDLGVSKELSSEELDAKHPELVASSRFDFEGFSRVPTFALAQSLFSHLTPDQIELCLVRLRAFVRPGCRFFATFLEHESVPGINPRRSHDHRLFGYAPEVMSALGVRNGWSPRFIGDWGHPRGQVMIEYVAS
jgi:hypothetical protein